MAVNPHVPDNAHSSSLDLLRESNIMFGRHSAIRSQPMLALQHEWLEREDDSCR
jgi:hypothetical protein